MRDERGRLLPGCPANNPRGRPKTGLALAEAVREHVDPAELVRLALDLARGLPAVRDLEHLRKKKEAERAGLEPPPIEGVEVVWPSHADRMSALTFLADRGWSKPVAISEVSLGVSAGAPAPTMDYSKLSQAELDALEAISAKAAGLPTPHQVTTAIDVAVLVGAAKGPGAG
jgi:hypothetical protein